MKIEDLAGVLFAAELEDTFDTPETALRFWRAIVADSKVRGHDYCEVGQRHACSLCTFERFMSLAERVEPNGLVALLTVYGVRR